MHHDFTRSHWTQHSLLTTETVCVVSYRPMFGERPLYLAGVSQWLNEKWAKTSALLEGDCQPVTVTIKELHCVTLCSSGRW